MPVHDNRTLVLALRAVQAIFAIIVLGLTGYVAHWWHYWWHASSPSQDNFLLFTAIWTLLALIFLIAVPWRFSETRANHHFAILAVEAVTMIFWFAGFIALAVFVSDVYCHGGVCSAAEAAVVFGAFEWLLFAATTTLAAMHSARNRDSSNTRSDPTLKAPESVEVI